MRHALFVAFHYPPESSSSGVLRTLKYTRYLGAHGWRVTVLTVRPDAYEVVDPALMRQVPPEVRVVRTAYLDSKRHLSVRGLHLALTAIPDRWIGWWPWGVRAGRRILRDDPPELIYSTSPHATAHLIAASLARTGRVPWVTDFRDPWYEDPPEPGTPRVVHRAARRLERMVVRRAALVIGSTRRLRDVLAARYPDEPPVKFAAIPNGFDEADFTALPLAERSSGDELVVVHAGNVNAEFRDPRPVFEAVGEAVAAGDIDPGRLRFRFLGGGPYGESAAVAGAVTAAGLTGRVQFLPRVPYDAALRELTGADMLLLLQASADTVDLVPAKLFEYLRAGRPVLAVVRPGATTEVLAQVGGGWAVDPRDGAGLRQALVAACAAWRAGHLGGMAASAGRLQGFSRAQLTAELARHFDRLVRGPGPAA
ncbi:MAG: glycosyltransferase family 4 protein [Candidatus Rokubacteria bacterium]|nr:glycosyltransferase family 4 protein [Candidatus Rokubacteria bacterium]